MGRLMQHIIEEEENFWADCQDVISYSENIQDFYRNVAALEKDGTLKFVGSKNQNKKTGAKKNG